MILIKRDEMLAAIETLNLIPQRAGIPSSDYVRIIQKKKKLEMALASSVTGVVRVATDSTKEEEPFFVDRRLMIPFLQMGKHWKGDFKTELGEGKWLVRQGSRKADFALRKDPIGGYLDWKSRDGLKEIKFSDDLRKLLIASSQCATGDPSLQHLNCVYIGGRLVMSTNLAILFVGVRSKEDEMRFPFPVGIIPLLGEAKVKGVGVNGNVVILKCEQGYIEGTVSEIAKKDFPRKNLVTQIKKGRAWPVLTKLPAEKLSKLLSRMVDYLASVKREDWLVRLELGNGKIKASVKVQQGKFEETLTTDDAPSKDGFVEWPLDAVRPVIEYMAERGESVRIRVDESKRTPYLLSGGGIDLMVGRRVG